jgi:hypothetical protein
VSPEELAAIHPRLYHITRPEAELSIRAHGLLSTSALLNLFEVSGSQREFLETRRRPESVVLSHAEHGSAVLTDNLPLSEVKLAKYLNDDLTPADWMRLLNERVFFWVDQENVDNHLRAMIKDGSRRIVLMFDTLSVARSHMERLQLAPFNTGATIRKPARRGLSTFVPAHRHTYREWQRLRGKRDRIKELTLLEGMTDVGVHFVGYYGFGQPKP